MGSGSSSSDYGLTDYDSWTGGGSSAPGSSPQVGSGSPSSDLGLTDYNTWAGSNTNSGSFMDSFWEDFKSDAQNGPNSLNNPGNFNLDQATRDQLATYDNFNMGGLAPAPQGAGLNAAVDPQLQGAVNQIAQDPVGNRLIEAANNNGLTSIGVQNLGDGIMGMYWPDQNAISIDPGTVGGNDLVRTLAHELLHAATPRDGDSQLEEGLADRIGTEIQQRLTGFGPGYTLNTGGYTGLPYDNGIVDALRNIGIIV